MCVREKVVREGIKKVRVKQKYLNMEKLCNKKDRKIHDTILSSQFQLYFILHSLYFILFIAYIHLNIIKLVRYGPTLFLNCDTLIKV